MTAAVAQQQKRRDPPGAFEAEFVERKRRLGASWDAIAGMLERPTLDLRRAYDPEFRRSDFALAPIALAGPRTTSVLVCGKRTPVEGFSAEELCVLKALAHGEIVEVAGLRARVSGVDGDQVGPEVVRQLVRRVDHKLPAPLRIVAFGKTGYAIVATPGEKGKAPRASKAKPAPDPFGLGLAPVAVCVLKRLLPGDRAVSFEDLQQSTLELTGRPLSFDGMRARISEINRALPAGARVTSQHKLGYRLDGAERLKRREGGDV